MYFERKEERWKISKLTRRVTMPQEMNLKLLKLIYQIQQKVFMRYAHQSN